MTPERRRYARDYARRQHEAEIARRSQGFGTCQRRFGRFAVCGGALTTTVLRDGRTVTSCPRCERFTAGICRDCPAPVAGQVRKARRCGRCKALAIRASLTKYRENNRALVNRRAKRAARLHQQRNADYKRLWRAAHPEQVAAQKRRYMLRQPETVYAYQHEYRKTHRYHRHVRYCLAGCGTRVTGRVKKCAACKEDVRQSALRMLGRAA